MGIDSLRPSDVEPLLTGRFGHPYLYLDSCLSTQRELDPGLTEGACAVCDVQTAGRGRLGRAWEAPPGRALLCSILLRPPPGRRVAELSLVGGLAAAETVEQATGLATQIKWPNDVMLNRRKVAGVLAETSDDAVVLGIGVNVNQRRSELPLGARTPAASLYSVDALERGRAPLLAALLGELERLVDLWLVRGLEGLYHNLASRDFLRGRAVEVDGERAVAVGIDRQGRLELKTEQGRRLVESGEVSVVPSDDSPLLLSKRT